MRAFRVHAAVTARRSAGRRTARECCSPFRLTVFQWWDVTTAPAVISFISAGPEITMSVPNVPSTYFGNETKACGARYRYDEK
jgi:hypothetical protein